MYLVVHLQPVHGDIATLHERAGIILCGHGCSSLSNEMRGKGWNTSTDGKWKATHDPLMMRAKALHTTRCDCRLDQQRPRTTREEPRFSPSAFSRPELPLSSAWHRYHR